MPKPLLHPAALLAALVLAACGPEEGAVIEDKPAIGTLPSGASAGSGPDKAAVGTELCELDAYQGLIGTNVAATSFPSDPRLRVFSVDDIVTRDYIPQRTNIVYDKAGRITQVYCG